MLLNRQWMGAALCKQFAFEMILISGISKFSLVDCYEITTTFSRFQSVFLVAHFRELNSILAHVIDFQQNFINTNCTIIYSKSIASV